MLAGPIFSLETVTSARRPRYFVVRVLYAIALLVALCSVYSMWSSFERKLTYHDFAEFGAAFFNSFAALQLLIVVGLGPGLVAGTIAQERERRTIEYLFATDLSDSEIVLGKLTARLLLLFYLVLVGLPILSIAMLLGGISPTRLALVFLMTASSMLMITGLSMAVSVWTPRARDAITRTYLLVLALLVLPPLATGVRGLVPYWLDVVLSPLVSAGLLVNPLWTLAQWGTPDPVGLSGVWSAAWPLVTSQLAIGGISLAAAVWGVRRVHLKHSSRGKTSLAWPRLWRPQLEEHPMIWKELFAERAVPQLGTLGRLLVVLLSAGVVVPTVVMFITTRGAAVLSDEFLYYAISVGTAVGCAGLLLLAARRLAASRLKKNATLGSRCSRRRWRPARLWRPRSWAISTPRDWSMACSH